MKFLVDESAGRSIVSYLRSQGHDVTSVQEDSPGIEDARVCERANREERVIITNELVILNWNGLENVIKSQ